VSLAAATTLYRGKNDSVHPSSPKFLGLVKEANRRRGKEDWEGRRRGSVGGGDRRDGALAVAETKERAALRHAIFYLLVAERKQQSKSDQSRRRNQRRDYRNSVNKP
jgi:hypothetical protein